MFGLSILYSLLSILIFTTSLIKVILYFNLKTNKELSETKKEFLTKKAIEQKELEYFYHSKKYIDSDDEFELGISSSTSKNCNLDSKNDLNDATNLNFRKSSFNKRVQQAKERKESIMHKAKYMKEDFKHKKEEGELSQNININNFIKEEQEQFEKRLYKNQNLN